MVWFTRGMSGSEVYAVSQDDKSLTESNKRQAIELVSRMNARILGIDDRLGILEKGKWASFICWSGDPFDLASYPVAVYGEGELLFSE